MKQAKFQRLDKEFDKEVRRVADLLKAGDPETLMAARRCETEVFIIECQSNLRVRPISGK